MTINSSTETTNPQLFIRIPSVIKFKRVPFLKQNVHPFSRQQVKPASCLTQNPKTTPLTFPLQQQKKKITLWYHFSLCVWLEFYLSYFSFFFLSLSSSSFFFFFFRIRTSKTLAPLSRSEREREREIGIVESWNGSSAASTSSAARSAVDPSVKSSSVSLCARFYFNLRFSFENSDRSFWIYSVSLQLLI